MNIYCVVSIFFIGFFLKVIDDIFDENQYHRYYIYIFSPIIILCYLFFGYLSKEYALINFGIIFGCFISLKLDNHIFKLLGIIGITPFLLHTASSSFSTQEILGVIGLILACCFDEILNNLHDDRLLTGMLSKIGKYRLLAKLVTLSFSVIGIWTYSYSIIIIFFDIGYYLPVIFMDSLTSINNKIVLKVNSFIMIYNYKIKPNKRKRTG